MKLLILAFLALSASAFKVREHHGTGGRIVNGQLAAKGDFPYIIDVRFGGHYCGGSIYNENWIITAAHCANEAAIGYTVVAGEHNLSIDDGDEQPRHVDLIVQHPDYNSDSLANDIALMRVSEPFVLGQFVATANLNTKLNTQFGNCIVAGWGSTNGNPANPIYPNELYNVVLPIVTDAECANVMGHTVTESNICAGDIAGGGSACYADSGGPLILRKGNVDVLTGLVSWGPSFCGSANNYSVYCEIAHFVDWISLTVYSN